MESIKATQHCSAADQRKSQRKAQLTRRRESLPSTGRKTLVEIEELDTLALRTAIDVQRKDAFGHICPLTEEKVPPT
jgi:hypothetical protein